MNIAESVFALQTPTVATGPGIAQVWNMCSLPVGGVIVWDHGTYVNRTEYEMTRCLRRGHLSFHLHGEKLHGGYALTRIREGKNETWLLIKRRDDEADARRNPVRTRPESVLSGRTLDELS
jgi:hypothetical protein